MFLLWWTAALLCLKDIYIHMKYCIHNHYVEVYKSMFVDFFRFSSGLSIF